MPREKVDVDRIPVELEPELFGYRRPTPENEEVGRGIIAERSGYPSVEALEAAIANGTCDPGVASAWKSYLDRTEERQLENAKVVAYLDRANNEAYMLRALHRRVLELEHEVEWLLSQQNGKKPPKTPALHPKERD